MDFNKKRYQKYRPIINKTVHRLLKEDRFDFDVGYSFINVDDHVFFGLDVNQFVDEFFKKKYFTKPKYRNYKYVFFISRSFPDDFLKKEKVTTIDFPPVLMRNLKVKTPLSITDLLRLNDSVLKHFPLMYFLRSIYDNKYNADQQMLDSGDFEKILESGQKKKIADRCISCKLLCMFRKKMRLSPGPWRP